MNRNYRIIGSIILALTLLIGGCSPQATPTSPAPTDSPTMPVEPSPAPTQPELEPTSAASQPAGETEMISDKPRITDPQVDAEQIQSVVHANTAFALNLYQTLREKDENIFYSPYSIFLALSMTSAGASDETLAQMLATLQWDLTPAELHAAINALDLDLEAEPEVENGLKLTIANSLWGQAGYPFQAEFLDTLAQYYGSGLQTVDFNDSEPVRQQINAWVASQTNDKIQDLFPQGSITDLTRLVLANAIYFKAGWLYPFNAEATAAADFTLLDGSPKKVQMMHVTDRFGYVQGDGYEAINLPYNDGTASMVAIMPTEGAFADFEAQLTPEMLQSIVDTLGPAEVNLSMPRFKIESTFDLGETMAALGMVDAFDPQAANFSGMDGSRDLYISSILHKAYVDVNEEGTEAAAATGVMVGTTSLPTEIVDLSLDHPFLFLIMDNRSGAVIFIGRVVNP